MRTKTTLLTAALAVLLLTGCSGSPETAPTAKPNGADKTAETATETVAPLVAETVAPADEDRSTPESDYLAAVRAVLRADTQIPDATDEQLLAAGHQACEQLATGIDNTEVRVIDGETAGPTGFHLDSNAIAVAASKTLCVD